jgi:drug/metabolite transporter (DMT)-like permease
MPSTHAHDSGLIWLLVLAIGQAGVMFSTAGWDLAALGGWLTSVLLFCSCCRIDIAPLRLPDFSSWRMTRFSANLVLLLAAAIWGGCNVAQQTVLEHMGPVTVSGVRCLFAALVVMPIALYESPARARFTSGDWVLLGSIVTSFSAGLILAQIGFGGTSVTNAGFLINTGTVMTPILAWLLFRASPRWITGPAAAATLAGVWLLGGASWTELRWGDGVCLISAAAYSLWIVLMSTLATRTGRPLAITAIQFAGTAAIGLTVGLLTEPFDWSGFLAALPQLLLLGIVSTGGAFLLSAIAQQYTPASDAAILMSAESLFGALAAVLLLGESLSPIRMLGAGLLLAAIILVQLPDWRPRWRTETVRPARPTRRVLGPSQASGRIRRPMAPLTS